MINVSCNDLKESITQLTGIIDNYELTKVNLFRQLNNSCISWNDGNSILFSDYIDKEATESDLFLSTLKEIKKVYNDIYNRYVTIGFKVRCELGNYSNSARKVEDCINCCTNILSSLSSVNYDVSNVISIVNDVKSKLNHTSKEIHKYYKLISKYELEIAGIIKNITIDDIDLIEFKLTQTGYNKKCFIIPKELEKDIKYLQFYISEESTLVSDLFDKFESTMEFYKSSTNGLFNSVINEANSAFELISSKRTKYVSLLNKVLENYSTGYNNVINSEFNIQELTGGDS